MRLRLVIAIHVLDICYTESIYDQWIKAKGHMDEGTFHSVNLSVYEQCLELCQYVRNCVSVNWSPGMKRCELKNVSKGKLTDTFHWVFARKKVPVS